MNITQKFLKLLTLVWEHKWGVIALAAAAALVLWLEPNTPQILLDKVPYVHTPVEVAIYVAIVCLLIVAIPVIWLIEVLATFMWVCVHIGHFVSILTIKYFANGEFRETLFNGMKLKGVTYSVNVTCTLETYQTVLSNLADSIGVTSLKWTNIFPPGEHKGKPHNLLFSEFKKEKYRFCIIGSENQRDWLDQFRDSESAFTTFEEESGRHGGILRYVHEDDLVRFQGEEGVKLRFGDYAIIETWHQGSMLISYNPTTKDRKRGELSFAFGNLDSYPGIFKFYEKRGGIKDAANEIFYQSFGEMRVDRLKAESLGRKLRALPCPFRIN